MKLCQFCSAIMGILCAVILLGCENDDVIVDSSLPAPTKIAFTFGLDPSNNDIYVINPDGTNLVNITKSEANEYSPDWSPDGRKIAFPSRRGGSSTTNGIYVMNADGKNVVNIYSDVNGCGSGAPAWSPDGKRIAFGLGCDNVEGTTIIYKTDIYVMNADGTNLVNITKSEANEYAPAWSPDGRKIAFTSWLGSTRDIYVMNADGTNAIKITKSEGRYGNPAWSPDGKKIAFEANLSDNQEIYIMNINGADVINLSNHPATDLSPAWSPDGKKIAFVSNRMSDSEFNLNLYVMNADGTDQIAIYSDRGEAYGPSWTSGQKRIGLGVQGALDILAPEKIQ